MTKTNKIAITPERAALMTQEYQLMMDNAHGQLVEHKFYLHHQLNGVQSFDAEVIAALHRSIDEITVVQVQMEPHVKDMKGNNTISVVYDYPDLFCEFCDRPDAPQVFKDIFKGGIVLDDTVKNWERVQ